MSKNETTKSTPLERAAEALLRDYQGQYEGGQLSEFMTLARAALEAAIDEGEIARLVAGVDISWHAMRGMDGQEPLDVTMAAAIKAHVLGGAE